jgi:hypothetical protein
MTQDQMNDEEPVAWLREVDAGTDNACLFVCIEGDPGSFPVYANPFLRPVSQGVVDSESGSVSPPPYEG